jgi:hypothetical protein
MRDEIAQEFLEFLNIRISRYYLEREECKDGERSYQLKTNAWAVENVREEFLALFEDRVDFEESLIGAEEEAKYELSQRPTIVSIRLPGDPDYEESSKEAGGEKQSSSEFMAETTLRNRADRRERRRKRLKDNPE